MNKILNWQYQQLVKEILLLQDHMPDPRLPVRPVVNRVREHLFTIEAYAQE